MSTNKRQGSPTARNVVGSLAVIGTAAAVAGLGTYGNFTDSTTPMNTTLATGTLSINLASVGTTVPLAVENMVPGDSMSRAVDLVNDGDLAMSSINMGASTTSSNILTTDTTNGLRLLVRSCSVPWTEGSTATGPTYSCSGTERSLMNGPVINSTTLSSPASLNPGGSDHLVFSVSLPSTAGNEFQGLSADLSLSFTGASRSGTAR